MVRIESYMNDGANWQAQAILAYLKSHINCAIQKSWNPLYRSYDVDILVGRYENGREQGYVVSVLYQYIKAQKTFAFYEHRNSDNIYVLHTDELVGFDTPSKEIVYDKYKDKWDCDKSFKFGEIVECGDYILDEIENFVNEWVEKDSEYFNKMAEKAERVEKIMEEK